MLWFRAPEKVYFKKGCLPVALAELKEHKKAFIVTDQFLYQNGYTKPVENQLDAMGIAYTVNPTIVRGLDYYTRTVFEFVSDDIGAQGTVCGGGRYDGLIEEIGGAPTPAVGFAAGLERLLIVMEASGAPLPPPKGPKVYLAGLDGECRKKAFVLAQELRAAGISAETDHMERSVKAQFKYADKIGAEYVAVIGGNELAAGEMNVKRMADSTSEKVPFAKAAEYFSAK